MRSRRRIPQGILGVLLTVVYFVFLNDIVKSLIWHVAHGNTVAYSGHMMTLPLMWRQEYSSGAVLRLSRAAFFHPFINDGLSGPESLAFGSGASGSVVVDDAGAARWQRKIVAGFKVANLFAEPENLPSQEIISYCFNRDDASMRGGCLDCKASGTNWEVVFGVGDGGAGHVQEQLEEARGILKSMR